MFDRLRAQLIRNHQLQSDMLRGYFGLEKENNRVDEQGRLALTPHPKAFGRKMENPYIRTDFSESQIEMITPVFSSIDETYDFMETLHDIVTLELLDNNEYLWPSSNPPILPNDEDIPIAVMNDPEEDRYRVQLANKYGRKRQLMSGIHFNFSFDDEFLKKLYSVTNCTDSFKEFKNALYMRVARNVMNYRWLLIYLTGASPVFSRTYLEQCAVNSEQLDDGDSRFFPNMNSLRNSVCGYRNEKNLHVSYDSLEAYTRDLQSFVRTGELLSVREYYSPIRLKTGKGKGVFEELTESGIDYLELRMIDLNPLYKIGISIETMRFVHLFLISMLLLEDLHFNEKEQKAADLNHDSLLFEGILGKFYGGEEENVTLQEKALEFLNELKVMLELIWSADSSLLRILEQEKEKILEPKNHFAARVKKDVQSSSYIWYHMDKAKQYALESKASGYQLKGCEDLELSTQLLLKAAIKRGISFELLDFQDNFVLLTKGTQQQYVKQATKTSLDRYSTVLVMENKVVTKKVLQRHGIRVPDGEVYHTISDALKDYELYRDQPIVIKPNSTNFGQGITIFAAGFSSEDYRRAFEIAFRHDRTVLLEKFMTGKEYRFLVMGEEVVGVLHRVPANVVGDGLHTIEQLVHEKNKDPLRGKGYKTPLERIELGESEIMFLKSQSKHTEYVPALGETVYLRENSNISTGGDSIDFTDNIPYSYKQIAVQAAKAAGAVFCGVDMMIDDTSEEASDTNYSIIEINFNPAIHIHCYPYEGKNRKADERILDLLFGSISSNLEKKVRV
ncbi:bifunctional glutamate--cysteine ligase GshA/glutathione synthetase GshB [Marinicrinis lubricantis]|uniref:Glutathione biosynthesis bifunctional protein GshAB n=1 Tax=Marinicrinis lubricantis TaxID=2086470 RepID=A0ABW1IRI6_9BACL